MVAAIAGVPAPPPRDVVQSAVSRVIAVLLAEADQPARDMTVPARNAREAARAEIRRIAAETFDFEEMARRTLLRQWATRTPAEHAEFIRLFTDMLERAYIGRLEAYAGEKVVYLGSALDGPYATVRSKIARRGRNEIGLDYRLHLVDSKWKVYDLIIDGVSFVSTYRAEFNRVIQSSSFEELLNRMKKREIVAERL
ncbi:MAG: ABC transporter substrate-binding protein [Candidatus Rokubacteria bacterium]|nr:ABC transporter substrate-binding protein [Candidatus Rokubacteria bacterium]